nr:hypothetical protein [Eubacterium sp.]
MKEAKKTLYRVILLIWGMTIVVIVAGMVARMFLTFSLLAYVLGLLLGSGMSTVLMLHRFSSIDLELDLEEKSATNHSKAMATLRTLLALAALIVAFRFSNFFMPLMVFVGLFITKVAALLYPVFFRDEDLPVQ